MAYVYQDDALAPKGLIVIEYQGRHPLIVYEGLPKVFQTLLEVKGNAVFEDDFRWDVIGDPHPFFIKFHVEKKFDKWTMGEVGVNFFGAHPKDPNKIGRLTIELTGWLKTSYPFSTPLQKLTVLPFILAYHYSMYNKIRRKYLKILQEKIELLEGYFRDRLNIPMREKLAGEEYGIR